MSMSRPVAAVVSAWTGIPVWPHGARDEIQSILTLTDTLNKRVIGQGHGIEMIAKRIETNRAKLDNPNKPIGVFHSLRAVWRRQNRDGAGAGRGDLLR